MNRVILICFICFSFYGRTQRFFENDTTLNVKRVAWTSSAIGAGWIGSTVALQTVWYKDHWSKFHFFNDSKEWLGMDKFGHAYTSYAITKNISSFYRWSGVERKTSLLIGSSVGFGYQATIEILDGFAKDWGFSWSDIAGNAFGVAWYAWQDLIWQEQRFKFKYSVHLSPYAQYRPEMLGNNIGERLLKDYNGQTYWLSVSPGLFLPSDSKFPKWLSFSVGYSVDSKLHGDNNEYTYYGPNGDSKVFNAHSKFLFSLDIDFEQIPTKKRWLQVVFKGINHIKIPFPAMVITGNKVGFHPFYF